MGCCDKSNEVTPATTPVNLDWLPQVIHSNTEDAFSCLRNAMPIDDGVQRPFGRPTIHKDGSIEYPVTGSTPPAEINGYVRDASNHWLFRPLWPPCVLRMGGVKLDRKTGEINVIMVCNHPEAALFQKRVTAGDCQNCPVLKRKNPAQPEG